ncbi:hypothetical protein ACOMHN_054458 [Nucella lapillus]
MLMLRDLLDGPAKRAVGDLYYGLSELAYLNALAMLKRRFGKDYESFIFHDNHGSGVTLSKGNRTATKSQDSWNGIVLSRDPTKSQDSWNGIVLSRDPLEVGMLFEVRIDKWVGTRQRRYSTNSLLVGMSAKPPASFTLPSRIGQHKWPALIAPLGTICLGLHTALQDWSAQVASLDRSSRHHLPGASHCTPGLVRNNKVGAALDSLGERHRMGLALDSARAVHLYVDGQHQGIAVPSMPDPCYAVFDVNDRYEQVRAWGIALS